MKPTYVEHGVERLVAEVLQHGHHDGKNILHLHWKTIRGMSVAGRCGKSVRGWWRFRGVGGTTDPRATSRQLASRSQSVLFLSCEPTDMEAH